MTINIDGKAFAAHLTTKLAEHVTRLKAEHQLTPGLAVVLVGHDPASEVYVRNKHKQTVQAGMNSFEHKLPADVSESTLLNLLDQLNRDPAVHGILVQLPLPKHIDEQKVLAAIDPDKDVDGFHVVNAGRLFTGQDSLVPCTPYGCLLLLQDYFGPQGLRGKNAVVVGRSNIVGKPMAQLLLGADCTVTIAHSKTKDLPALCRSADILVAAIGRPEFVKGDWVSAQAVVIDVGINRLSLPDGKTKLVGDCAYQEMFGKVAAITPVPGGVGPMTIACLLRNTIVAACRQFAIEGYEV